MARMLIVEREASLASSLTDLLRQAGEYETRVAHSAATALQEAVAFEPALCFVDIDLPDMSGHELAKLMHQHPRLQLMRLIALTDSPQHAGREDARASGFERFLVKPVTLATLREVLDLPGT